MQHDLHFIIIIINRRIDDTHNTWQMPQGGIDPLENPMVAALRELREETGMRSVVLLGTLDGWLDYDFPTEVRSQMSSTWLRFRGQTQKWYADMCTLEHEEVSTPTTQPTTLFVYTQVSRTFLR